MTTRALWNGTLSFGLVHIPVALHSNEKKRDPDFNLVDRRDHAPIGHLRVNKRTGEEISPDDIVRSYTLADGDYVIVPEEEFQRATPEFSRSIRLLSFASLEEIKPVYFESPYYLEPTAEGEKGYALLLDVLSRTRKIGIARIVLRSRERMAVLIPDRSVLVLNTLRFAEELRHPRRLDQPPPDPDALGVTPKELEMAERLVEEMTASWQPMEHRDEYRDQLLAYIRRKSKTVIGEPAVEPASEAPKSTPKGKFLTLLERSLAKAAEARRRRGSKTA
jgi:DNA end-binding protein Ku